MAGFKRPIGFFASPLTIIINLNHDIRYNRNWKRNLDKALNNQLIFEEVRDIKNDEIEKFIQLLKENAELKNISYNSSFIALKSLIDSNDTRTFFVRNKNKSIIAARTISFNKGFYTDTLAAASKEARDTGATFFVIINILNLLKTEKADIFDFNRIPPSNDSKNGVYLFKNGCKGDIKQYNGEWVYYKYSIIEHIVYIYKYFFLKKVRY